MTVLHDLVIVQVPIVEKVLRTVLVYVLIVLLFRFTGKRGLAGLNTFDFVVIFLLSNVVQNAVIGQDNSLLGGAIGAVTLVAVNVGLNRVNARSSVVRRLLEGSATTVITDGQVDEGAIRRLGIDRAELDHAVRAQNGDDISEMAAGRLEPGGQLVLSLKPAEQTATKGDVAALNRRLDDLERLLRQGRAR